MSKKPDQKTKVLKGSLNPSHQKNAVRVNIATPCYGGKFSTAYVESMFKLLSTKNVQNRSFNLSTIDYADIVFARNYLISNFYFNQTNCSHLLFVDDDMGFSEKMIQEMINLDEDVVGVIAPKRSIDLKKLHALGDLDFKAAMAEACGFVGAPNKVKTKNGFLEVDKCGGGILLISRKAVERMIQMCPDIVDEKRFKKMTIASKFTRFLTPFDLIKQDDQALSEDYSFCHRWVHGCGGKIFVNISHDITHVGDIAIEAKFLDKMQQDLN